jgi:hypothetical protein
VAKIDLKDRNDEERPQVPSVDEPFVEIPVYRGFTEIAKIFDLSQQTHSAICGGYVRYMTSPRREPERPGDVDVFPEDDKSYSDSMEIYRGMGFEVKHDNEISTTLKAPGDLPYKTWPVVQIIKPVEEGHIVAKGDMETILRNFDFTVVRVGLLSSDTALSDPAFLMDEEKHRLRFRNIHCPVSSMLRAMKYARKGYWLPPSEALRLFMDWEERTDDYKANLIDLFLQSLEGEMTQKEIDRLEKLLRID